jgi:aldehyde:ferredoxin oxidoreductase
MHWSPFLDKEQGLSWDTIKSVGQHLYGTDKPVDPTSDYEDKEIAAVWHGHRSVLKDSVTVDDNMFPMILSFNYPDGRARALDMEGVDFEYHLFTSATGVDIGLEEMDRACERIFNLERAIQIRNYNRQRSDDETVIPYFEQKEWWENPYRGKKMELDREKFLPLLEKYYRLRGWDVVNGRPMANKLRQLGLGDVAQDLISAALIEEERIEG